MTVIVQVQHGWLQPFLSLAKGAGEWLCIGMHKSDGPHHTPHQRHWRTPQ